MMLAHAFLGFGMSNGPIYFGRMILDGWWLVLFSFGSFVACALVFWWLRPHRYEIWADRVGVVMGWPFKNKVSFNMIARPRIGRWRDALISAYASAAVCPILLGPSSSRNAVYQAITPTEPEEFLERLNEALAAYGQGGQRQEIE
jgi:hypothetical protein